MSARGKKNTKEETNSEEVVMKDTKQKGGAKKVVRGKTATSKSTKSTKTAKSVKSAKSGSKSAKSGSKSAKVAPKAAKKEASDRYFKLINPKTGKSYGRYTGDTPKQAASKGFTKMLQKLKNDGKSTPKQSTTIYLRESTRGSARKVYGYEASRLKLPSPQELVITDKETGEEKTIVYHFRNKIKKVPVPEMIGGAKTARSAKKGSKGSKSAKSAKGSKSAKSTKSTKSTKSAKPAKKVVSKKVGNKKSAPKKSVGKKAQSVKASSSR